MAEEPEPLEINEEHISLSKQIYHNSGKRAYDTFKKRVLQILKLASEIENMELFGEQGDALTSDEFTMALRLIAGELKKPTKRKPNEEWEQANMILDNKKKNFQVMVLMVYHQLDTAVEDAEERKEAAENTEHWNEDALQERIDMWEQRLASLEDLSSNDGLENAVEYIINGNFEELSGAIDSIPDIE